MDTTDFLAANLPEGVLNAATSSSGEDERLLAAAAAAYREGTSAPLVKEELRQQILLKRLRDGKPEIKTEFASPKKYKLTPAEERKKERRREQNRRAAKKCRDKKKQQASSVEETYNRTRRTNDKLHKEVNQLQDLELTYRTWLLSHIAVCSIQIPSRSPPLPGQPVLLQDGVEMLPQSGQDSGDMIPQQSWQNEGELPPQPQNCEMLKGEDVYAQAPNSGMQNLQLWQNGDLPPQTQNCGMLNVPRWQNAEVVNPQPQNNGMLNHHPQQNAGEMQPESGKLHSQQQNSQSPHPLQTPQSEQLFPFLGSSAPNGNIESDVAVGSNAEQPMLDSQGFDFIFSQVQGAGLQLDSQDMDAIIKDLSGSQDGGVEVDRGLSEDVTPNSQKTVKSCSPVACSSSLPFQSVPNLSPAPGKITNLNYSRVSCSPSPPCQPSSTLTSAPERMTNPYNVSCATSQIFQPASILSQTAKIEVNLNHTPSCSRSTSKSCQPVTTAPEHSTCPYSNLSSTSLSLQHVPILTQAPENMTHNVSSSTSLRLQPIPTPTYSLVSESLSLPQITSSLPQITSSTSPGGLSQSGCHSSPLLSAVQSTSSFCSKIEDKDAVLNLPGFPFAARKRRQSEDSKSNAGDCSQPKMLKSSTYPQLFPSFASESSSSQTKTTTSSHHSSILTNPPCTQAGTKSMGKMSRGERENTTSSHHSSFLTNPPCTQVGTNARNNKLRIQTETTTSLHLLAVPPCQQRVRSGSVQTPSPSPSPRSPRCFFFPATNPLPRSSFTPPPSSPLTPPPSRCSATPPPAFLFTPSPDCSVTPSSSPLTPSSRCSLTTPPRSLVPSPGCSVTSSSPLTQHGCSINSSFPLTPQGRCSLTPPPRSLAPLPGCSVTPTSPLTPQGRCSLTPPPHSLTPPPPYSSLFSNHSEQVPFQPRSNNDDRGKQKMPARVADEGCFRGRQQVNVTQSILARVSDENSETGRVTQSVSVSDAHAEDEGSSLGSLGNLDEQLDLFMGECEEDSECLSSRSLVDLLQDGFMSSQED